MSKAKQIAAAALLCGWYLMHAPWAGPHGGRDLDGNAIPNRDAPLWQWTISQSNDSAAQCEAARARDFDSAKPLLSPKAWMRSRNKALEASWYATDQCIASDDPRLKKK